MIHTSLDQVSYNPFIEQQLRASLYYSPDWLNLITRLYGYELIPLTSLNANGQVTGLLPLCLMQSPLTGRRLVSLPFSDHCPLLATDEASAHDLIDQAIQLAQRRKVHYLELRTGTNAALARRSDLLENNLYVSWLLPLAPDSNIAWSGFKKPVQQKVRKAQKLGVQVRLAERREDMAQYYRLHLLTRSKKHGMPAQSKRFFFGLWDTFAASSTLHLLLAEYQGTIIASTILLAAGSTIHYAYNASDERYLHLAPNNLLMWRAITWSSAQGYQTVDLGRTAQDNQGLMEFKRAWGAIKEPLPYYYYPHVAGLTSTSEDSWKYRLLTSCWKRLPLWATGPLGGYFYKHLG